MEEIWKAVLGQAAVNQLLAIDWVKVIASSIKVLLIIALTFLLMRAGSAAVDRFFHKWDNIEAVESRRVHTLRTLMKSGLRYTLYFVSLVTILNMFGVRVEAILAGAGVVGLAVGFGAQNLVRDVITGFFLLLEDQFAVGDYITVAGVSGTVEEMGLRVTRLRDFGGELHIIPNGQIIQVTNHSRGNMRALVEVGVAYEENLDRVIDVLQQVCEQAARDMADIIAEGPHVLGVVNFGQSDVVIRIIAYTKPMQQWYVERELRRLIKEAFDREGIEIPYPRRVVLSMSGGAKHGQVSGW
ncbi:mechanosensitive ion channel family protein [Desulfofundulus thermocisternus]|uniref:mechanosensitive ion channel family protein n=1 Tax=Desulfofundulus thermocisternus TaxID=42471 RepID=UPI001A0A4642|nr:mechanosensitive ion channel family protein [Desulfofundulus thermocisternus]MBE3586744.1 mechanosensitive ion channel family protein [Thermoanaerobacter sp.]MCS5697036.1 mechanosensitive ion channel family protein [Desulfofundulus thermocisternus]